MRDLSVSALLLGFHKEPVQFNLTGRLDSAFLRLLDQ